MHVWLNGLQRVLKEKKIELFEGTHRQLANELILKVSTVTHSLTSKKYAYLSAWYGAVRAEHEHIISRF